MLYNIVKCFCAITIFNMRGVVKMRGIVKMRGVVKIRGVLKMGCGQDEGVVKMRSMVMDIFLDPLICKF